MAKASPAADKCINRRIVLKAGAALTTAGPALLRGDHAEAQPRADSATALFAYVGAFTRAGTTPNRARLQQGFATDEMGFRVKLRGNNREARMSALGGGFNRSTQHLLILLEKEVCDGGDCRDCTDMVHVAAEG